MMVRVNKKTDAAKKPVQYAMLSSGTISHVWCNEDEPFFEKRTNKIKLTREKGEKASTLHFDA